MTTGSTDHPIEQPSVSNRAWAEGRDPGGAKTGAIKNPGPACRGAAQAPLQPPVSQATENLKYRIWFKSYMPQGNMLVWPYDAEKPPCRLMGGRMAAETPPQRP